uniref:Uncharacterized protein n=1 Tax=Anopheles atroparvus TaxID=41427 RepID=A0A182J9G5_ANOAO
MSPNVATIRCSPVSLLIVTVLTLDASVNIAIVLKADQILVAPLANFRPGAVRVEGQVFLGRPGRQQDDGGLRGGRIVADVVLQDAQKEQERQQGQHGHRSAPEAKPFANLAPGRKLEKNPPGLDPSPPCQYSGSSSS